MCMMCMQSKFESSNKYEKIKKQTFWNNIIAKLKSKKMKNKNSKNLRMIIIVMSYVRLFASVCVSVCVSCIHSPKHSHQWNSVRTYCFKTLTMLSVQLSTTLNFNIGLRMPDGWESGCGNASMSSLNFLATLEPSICFFFSLKCCGSDIIVN